ncbi:hypothetical protein [Streptomyces broussonetiae]|uniref:Uncharacterized protein n=1 Tax=Streptomyces broussonetiae TaxID=2686304 RepID=A0A6I6NCL9_9ACTN|nr:hypothetical protein [Streptomyces broussonetiae]QHA05887.1 hypothetical protein GQF42_23685 [Streptomyces broussonetiae]
MSAWEVTALIAGVLLHETARAERPSRAAGRPSVRTGGVGLSRRSRTAL